jgi:hypothetical protein
MIYSFRINITENKIFFENFNISENNIISVELAWLLSQTHAHYVG